MVKTLNSKISDPRPRINVALSSDDDKTTAEINKGYVNVQRGLKKAILRVPYGEVDSTIDLLQEASKVLKENGYDPSEGSDIPANAVAADETDANPAVPGSAEAAGVVSAVTTGEGGAPAAPDSASTTADENDENASEDAQSAQEDFDNEPSRSTSNPFAASNAG